MTSFLCFSVCFFGWGLAMFLMTFVSRSLNLSTILACNLVGYILTNLFVLPHVKVGWTLSHGLAVLIGVLFVVSNLAYYQLSKLGGQASILAPLTSLYVVVTILLGFFILGEPSSPRKWAGILLALAAIYLLSTTDVTSDPKAHEVSDARP
ncbi:MAG: EamA family transporter [Planctomycetes bacterium]|nr:EamA family transporter [Planctomycetota bacterium]